MQKKKSCGDTVVLFASKPDLNELCALSVRVETPETGSFNTTQPRILKCRELIFTEPEVIASPSYDQYDCFNVIMPQTLFKTGRVQTRMKNKGLQASRAFRVNPGVYQACLRYAVLARLAPAWNKAGDWLIQECDLVANKDELFISLCATVIRLSPLQLVDLNLSQLEVQSLLYQAEHHSGELSLPNSWCQVMPSMKKGRLCSISLSIPEDSPFTSYKDLKRHWKNTYGFRLPETDDDMFFGQISFWGLGGKQFTYPSVCLRADALQCLPRMDPKPILSAFLQDLHGKVSSACGHPLRFQPQVRHAVPALYTASQEVRGPGPNLGRRSSTGASQVPLRDPRVLTQRSTPSQQLSNQPSHLATLKASAHKPSDEDCQSGASSQTFCWPSQPLSQSQRAPCLSKSGNSGETWSRLSVTSTPERQSRGEERSEDTMARMSTNSTNLGQSISRKSSDGTSGWPYQGQQRSVPQRRPLSLHRPSPLPTVDADSTHGRQFLPKTSSTPRENHNASPMNQFPDTPVTFQSCNSSLGSSSNRESGMLTSSTSSRNEANSSNSKPWPPKFVPVFKPKTSSNKSSCAASTHRSEDSSGRGKIVPTFRPKMIKSSISTLNNATAKRSKHLPTTSRNKSSLPTNLNDSILVSCPKVTSSTGDSLFPSTPSTFPIPKQPVFHTRPPHLSKDVRSPSLKSSGPRTPQAKTPLAGKLKQKMLDAGKAGAGKAASVKAAAIVHHQNTPQQRQVTSSKRNEHTEIQLFDLSQTLTPASAKRKTDTEGVVEVVEKKARSKPQVQDVDVETLAKADQLAKVNAVTLMAWLRERGVHCKAKDKKADLVDRVKVFLAISSAEP